MIEILGSAQRIATTTSNNFTPTRRGWLWVEVTALAATPSVTPSIELYNGLAGTFHTIWTAAAAVTGVGRTLYYFTDQNEPASWSEMTELAKEHHAADQVRVSMTHGDSDAITYSVAWLEETSV